MGLAIESAALMDCSVLNRCCRTRPAQPAGEVVRPSGNRGAPSRAVPRLFDGVEDGAGQRSIAALDCVVDLGRHFPKQRERAAPGAPVPLQAPQLPARRLEIDAAQRRLGAAAVEPGPIVRRSPRRWRSASVRGGSSHPERLDRNGMEACKHGRGPDEASVRQEHRQTGIRIPAGRRSVVIRKS